LKEKWAEGKKNYSTGSKGTLKWSKKGKRGLLGATKQPRNYRERREAWEKSQKGGLFLTDRE